MTHRPDPITAKDSGGGFDPHPEGQWAMRCVDVIDLGTTVYMFGGQPNKAHKVSLVFASGERNKDGRLLLVTTEYTNSMNEKANLRKFLESWRGKSYTAEQAEAGVPLDKLHGQSALATIEHKRTKRERLFANVTSISPLPKQIPAPGDDVLTDYERPPFFEERRKEYAKQLQDHLASEGDPGPQQVAADDDEDDLPFSDGLAPMTAGRGQPWSTQ